MEFRSSIRRGATRKSGFNASGKTTGSEVKITNAIRFEADNQKVGLKFSREKVVMVPLFGANQGMIAFASYIFPYKPCTVSVKMSGIYNGNQYVRESSKLLEENKWNRIGLHGCIELENGKTEVSDLCCILEINGLDNVDLNIASSELNAVNYENYIDNEQMGIRFRQKTSATTPETYYFSTEVPLEDILVNITKVKVSSGKTLVMKSCNRCTRFLPINVEEEKNKISFSNHCIKNAPCKHSAFSKYRIVERMPSLDKGVSSKIQENSMHLHYGYQLECVACKKYYVNAPLNPIRTSTQHREDSLRRRAFEVLADKILGNEWIYFEHRKKTGEEFDVHIWNKFDRKCFKCKEPVSKDGYNIDHTMPLAYLWPLDIHATCLCPTCNGRKSDSFPVDFYSGDELESLIKVTGIDRELVTSRKANQAALDELKKRVVWFFDDFLNHRDYQKVREEKLTADLIFHSLLKVISTSKNKFDLVEDYFNATGKYPSSITIKKTR